MAVKNLMVCEGNYKEFGVQGWVMEDHNPLK